MAYCMTERDYVIHIGPAPTLRFRVHSKLLYQSQ